MSIVFFVPVTCRSFIDFAEERQVAKYKLMRINDVIQRTNLNPICA